MINPSNPTPSKRINRPINLWLNREWKCKENKDFCDLIFHDQLSFNLIPCTVHNLDKRGISNKEIMSLDAVVGKSIKDLDSDVLEMLNKLESDYGISFNGEHKAALALGEITHTEMLDIPLNHILYAKNGDVWFGVCLIHSEAGRNFQLKLHS
jgi:hypothetical protein